MRTLWVITRREFTLQLRSKTIWFLACVMIFLGGLEVFGIRKQPAGAWGNLTFSLFLMVLIVTLFSGNQIHRDRECSLADVIWSTPVSTSAYIWGKYFGALFFSLALTLIGMGGAILIDQFPDLSFLPIYGQSTFPPLGAQFYPILWVWFVIIPVIFGIALTLATTTITRGQRIVAYVLTLLLWVASIGGGLSAWFDITGTRFLSDVRIPYIDAIAQISLQPTPLSPGQKMEVMNQVRAGIPPTWLSDIFAVNRLIFFLLAIAFISITVVIVSRQRQRTI